MRLLKLEIANTVQFVCCEQAFTAARCLIGSFKYSCLSIFATSSINQRYYLHDTCDWLAHLSTRPTMLLIRASFLTLGICCWNGAVLTMPHKANGRVARPCQGPNIPEANRRISHITHIVILCLEPVTSSRREQWQWQSSSSRFYLSSNTTVGTSTAVLRSTQPSTLRGTVKWVPAYGLSNNNNGDGGRGW